MYTSLLEKCLMRRCKKDPSLEHAYLHFRRFVDDFDIARYVIVEDNHPRLSIILIYVQLLS